MANGKSDARKAEILGLLRDRIQAEMMECLKDKSPAAVAALRFQTKHIGMVSAGIAAAVRGIVGQMLAMEDRLAARGFPYKGTWQKSGEYSRGDFCTHDGSMWFCCADTRERPGAGDAWQLAVKAGRDGKDGGR